MTILRMDKMSEKPYLVRVEERYVRDIIVTAENGEEARTIAWKLEEADLVSFGEGRPSDSTVTCISEANLAYRGNTPVWKKAIALEALKYLQRESQKDEDEEL